MHYLWKNAYDKVAPCASFSDTWFDHESIIFAAYIHMWLLQQNLHEKGVFKKSLKSSYRKYDVVVLFITSGQCTKLITQKNQFFKLIIWFDNLGTPFTRELSSESFRTKYLLRNPWLTFVPFVRSLS